MALVLGVLPALASEAPTACPDGSVPSAGFTDTRGTVHEANIDCVAFYDIATGTSTTTYTPAGKVTRAQMAVFLSRTINLARSLPTAQDQGYEDIRGTAFEKQINQLAAMDVARGTSATTYGPNLSISRGQMAVFLVRAWRAATGENLVRQGPRHFTDTNGTAFADEIDIIFEQGWTKGSSSGTYGPGLSVTRAAMASFLARFLDDLVAEGQATNRSNTDPVLESFQVSDPDQSFGLSQADSLSLQFDQPMVANSSITLQDSDGDRTIVDDQATAGVTDAARRQRCRATARPRWSSRSPRTRT